MTFASWLRGLARGSKPVRTRSHQPASRLAVEQLEGRTVLSTVTWTAGGTLFNTWSNTGNWALGRAPVTGDDVVFPNNPNGQAASVNDIVGLSLNSIAFQGRSGGGSNYS